MSPIAEREVSADPKANPLLSNRERAALRFPND
jgi:hypothetical protein